jgi:hypothetical protein
MIIDKLVSTNLTLKLQEQHAEIMGSTILRPLFNYRLRLIPW